MSTHCKYAIPTLALNNISITPPKHLQITNTNSLPPSLLFYCIHFPPLYTKIKLYQTDGPTSSFLYLLKDAAAELSSYAPLHMFPLSVPLEATPKSPSNLIFCTSEYDRIFMLCTQLTNSLLYNHPSNIMLHKTYTPQTIF
ncbi:hypothetical protein HanRHA438_Chr03g0097831 [Helianthus annuus]|nr:hypothetical protein HanPI659440_Chr03g0093671 [Helianthus annuus]KAJ0933583.1 hypothetical protein HanRHA438_Chr03g0097831 [Helianthus annuus]